MLNVQQILNITSQISSRSLWSELLLFFTAEVDENSISVKKEVNLKTDFSIKWVSEDLIKLDKSELTTANKVVSDRWELKLKAEFNKLNSFLADILNGAVDASQTAVNSDFANNSLQIEQTDKNVTSQLYLCAGISEVIQHLAEMKDSKVIATISDAPIFQIVDVNLVDDLFQKVPELTEKLKKQ